MKAINVITHLMSVLNLTPNKDLQSGGTQHISAYGSFPVGNDICIIRVADHNTFLYNWIDKNQHIDLTTSANYAITFVDEVPFHNNPNKDNIVNASNPPDVILRQYVYNVTALTDAEVTLVMDECIRLSQTGVFTDPLEEDNEKHAVIYRHRTNQPTKDMTNKTRKAHRKKKAVQNKKTISKTNNQPATDNNKTNKNESKNMNKKNAIRLTESDLKRVITESVKKVLKENIDRNQTQKLVENIKQKKKTINESQLRAIVKEAVRNVLKEGIDSQEERINAAVEALMSVREIVSRASDCWEYEDVNAPLFQQICAASSAIEGVMGFSKYGSDIRQQRNLEMSQQD